MTSRITPLLLVCYSLACFISAQRVAAQGPAYTQPEAAQADASFALQGEYVGQVRSGELKLGAQVMALGEGKFSVAIFRGGLPGAGWDGERRDRLEGVQQADGSVLIQGEQADGVLKEGTVTVIADGQAIGKLEKVSRNSPTLKKEPPAEAVVLFDGSSAEHWIDAELDGSTLAFAAGSRGTKTKQDFGSCSVHIEFRLPYMPQARGQQRGNSGLYLQGRYEVQMLDSFGLEGKNNECGGIYTIAEPRVNMCLPPLVWQTYDVDFTAAVYADDGQLRKHPRITVHHNGELIHDDVELPHSTTASPLKPGPQDGPLFLQNHGNPVRYRNIWVIPKE